LITGHFVLFLLNREQDSIDKTSRTSANEERKETRMSGSIRYTCGPICCIVSMSSAVFFPSAKNFALLRTLRRKSSRICSAGLDFK
jgi:hypothetical protein